MVWHYSWITGCKSFIFCNCIIVNTASFSFDIITEHMVWKSMEFIFTISTFLSLNLALCHALCLFYHNYLYVVLGSGSFYCIAQTSSYRLDTVEVGGLKCSIAFLLGLWSVFWFFPVFFVLPLALFSVTLLHHILWFLLACLALQFGSSDIHSSCLCQ